MKFRPQTTLHTRNNTDGNKLVIFSGIALYYGDTYKYSVVPNMSCLEVMTVQVLHGIKGGEDEDTLALEGSGI